MIMADIMARSQQILDLQQQMIELVATMSERRRERLSRRSTDPPPT
jgi:hypothetical protein